MNFLTKKYYLFFILAFFVFSPELFETPTLLSFSSVHFCSEKLGVVGQIVDNQKIKMVDAAVLGDKWLKFFDGRWRIWEQNNFTQQVLILVRIFILGFIANILFGTTVVLLHRQWMQMKTRKLVHFQSQYNNLISSWLFDDDGEKVISKLYFKKKPSLQNLLIDEIIRLQENFSGEIVVKLRELYYQLELQKVSVKKLKNYRWDVRAKGILEIRKMKVTEANPLIKKLLNAGNEAIRVEAHFAYLELNDSDQLSFLDKIKYPLTLWEQLNIHTILKNKKINNLDFSRWFHSPYLSVRLFSIKMAVLYEQMEVAPKLTMLLSDKNSEIRKQAIEALGGLYYSAASSLFKRIYVKEPLSNRIAILKSMELFQDEQNNDFLLNIFLHETNFEIRFYAAKSILASGSAGYNRIMAAVNDKDVEGQSIIRHLLDKRI